MQGKSGRNSAESGRMEDLKRRDEKAGGGSLWWSRWMAANARGCRSNGQPMGTQRLRALGDDWPITLSPYVPLVSAREHVVIHKQESCRASRADAMYKAATKTQNRHVSSHDPVVVCGTMTRLQGKTGKPDLASYILRAGQNEKRHSSRGTSGRRMTERERERDLPEKGTDSTAHVVLLGAAFLKTETVGCRSHSRRAGDVLAMCSRQLDETKSREPVQRRRCKTGNVKRTQPGVLQDAHE